MKRDIMVSVYDDEAYYDNLSQLDNLMKRLRALDFIMYRCNFSDGEIGETLIDMQDEINKKIKKLISRSESVDFYELDEKGNKIEIKFANEDEEFDK